MPPIQSRAGAHGDHCHKHLVDVDARHQRSVEPQEVEEEADDRVGDQIREENIARLESIGIPAGDP